MFTRPNPHDVTRFDRPLPIEITSDGINYCTGTQLLMVSTTLERLVLGARPFWGGKLAPIRTSVFPYPVPAARLRRYVWRRKRRCRKEP
jgi:hypothetical protein